MPSPSDFTVSTGARGQPVPAERAGARTRAAAFLAAATLMALTPRLASAGETIPVRVRVIKASRQGPPAVDPRLADLRAQLGRLAYQRWDELVQRDVNMELGKTVTFRLPDGAALDLTLVDARRDTVTFEVRVPDHHTHSRLTISKDKRIIHQVADEKNGDVFFATVRPWP